MTAGSKAPPGQAYAIKRDKPPGGTAPGPAFLTAPGYALREGNWTLNPALARRWRNRPAAHRFKARHPELATWYVATIRGEATAGHHRVPVL